RCRINTGWGPPVGLRGGDVLLRSLLARFRVTVRRRWGRRRRGGRGAISAARCRASPALRWRAGRAGGSAARRRAARTLLPRLLPPGDQLLEGLLQIVAQPRFLSRHDLGRLLPQKQAVALHVKQRAALRPQTIALGLEVADLLFQFPQEL